MAKWHTCSSFSTLNGVCIFTVVSNFLDQLPVHTSFSMFVLQNVARAISILLNSLWQHYLLTESFASAIIFQQLGTCSFLFPFHWRKQNQKKKLRKNTRKRFTLKRNYKLFHSYVNKWFLLFSSCLVGFFVSICHKFLHEIGSN